MAHTGEEQAAGSACVLARLERALLGLGAFAAISLAGALVTGFDVLPEAAPPPPEPEPRFERSFDVSTFQKGNLHAHSNWSDGDSSPADVYRWYRNNGYQFAVLSDHHQRVDPRVFAWVNRPDFVAVPGEEITLTIKNKPVHVNALCTSRTIGGKSFDDRRAGLGSSLACALRASLLDRKVPLWLKTDFRDLVLDGERVIGVRAMREGRELTLMARRGVILGAGGFEQNQALREKYLPQPTKAAWSATPPGNNTGAALEAGMAAGAATDLLEWAWWAPTIAVVGEEKPRGVFAERAFPGAIVVNALGKRFCNEAQGYLEFGDAMYKDREATGGKNVPAWCIFDARFRFNYAMGPLMPAQIMPDSRLRKEWLGSVYWKADTLDELARQIGVDPAGLAATVTKVNDYARNGKDADFGRGESVFDRYYGDVNVKPNPCLAPVQKGPFYAMRMDAGDIGTKGGLLTDAQARVVRPDGSPIEGLYAIGNTSASVMGTAYPGAGATIGPAMTFGYIAAHHIAGNA